MARRRKAADGVAGWSSPVILLGKGILTGWFTPTSRPGSIAIT